MSSSNPYMANPVFSSYGKLDFHLTCDIMKFTGTKVIRLNHTTAYNYLGHKVSESSHLSALLKSFSNFP